jgi:hypothetical protein
MVELWCDFRVVDYVSMPIELEVSVRRGASFVLIVCQVILIDQETELNLRICII